MAVASVQRRILEAHPIFGQDLRRTSTCRVGTAHLTLIEKVQDVSLSQTQAHPQQMAETQLAQILQP